MTTVADNNQEKQVRSAIETPRKLSPELMRLLKNKHNNKNWLDGARIRELMYQYHIRQNDIGTLMKVDQGLVSKWLSGQRPVTDKQLEMLAYHFGVTTDWLLGIDTATTANRADAAGEGGGA
jgi:plasmid maintenance system antidote protein VapI